MSVDPIVSDTSAVCLVGGAQIAETALRAVSGLTDSFVAVDSGADFLAARGVTPKAVIGDLDSISDDTRKRFASLICHVAEQETVDFEKALLRVSAPLVLAIGFTGGRLDHTLAVLHVALRHIGRAVVLVDADDASFLAPQGRIALPLDAGTRISVMPIAPVAAISLSGVQWPFTDRAMTAGGFTSPSNRASGGEVVLQTSDPVLVTLPLAQLAHAATAAVRAR